MRRRPWARARSPDSAAYVIGLGASAAAAAGGSISVPESRRECQDLRARHPIKFVRDNSREEKAKTDFRPTCPLVLLVFVTEKGNAAAPSTEIVLTAICVRVGISSERPRRTDRPTAAAVKRCQIEKK